MRRVVQSDGNGSIIMDKVAAVLIAIIIAILAAAGSAMITVNVTAAKLEHVGQDIRDITPVVAENTQRISSLEAHIDDNKNRMERIENKLDTIIEQQARLARYDG